MKYEKIKILDKSHFNWRNNKMKYDEEVYYETYNDLVTRFNNQVLDCITEKIGLDVRYNYTITAKIKALKDFIQDLNRAGYSVCHHSNDYLEITSEKFSPPSNLIEKFVFRNTKIYNANE